MSGKFSVAPLSLDRAVFIERFGGVYEHSAWIAEAVRDTGLSDGHDAIETMAAAMTDTLDAADDEAKLTPLRAHPGLAGKAAVRGELSGASTSEQAGAGLDQCSPAELARFQELNAKYKEKFGFPFILAVRGKHRAEILDAFEERIKNDQQIEFHTAIEQTHRIARLRLSEL